MQNPKCPNQEEYRNNKKYELLEIIAYERFAYLLTALCRYSMGVAICKLHNNNLVNVRICSNIQKTTGLQKEKVQIYKVPIPNLNQT